MGMMQGKVEGDTFVVVDSFALPVEGTETRVNAQEQAYEYLVTYPETAKVPLPCFCCLDLHLSSVNIHSAFNLHAGMSMPAPAALLLRSCQLAFAGPRFWHLNACRLFAATGTDRGRCWMVPLPPWLRLLALRHRLRDADDKPEVPGAVAGHRCGPSPHHVCRYALACHSVPL